MAELWAGFDQLPEQVSVNPRLGWSFQQSEGTHQFCGSHETVSVLQGICQSMHVCLALIYDFEISCRRQVSALAKIR
jgi:hypothetical protein